MLPVDITMLERKMRDSSTHSTPSSYQQDLRYLFQGIAVTLAVLGAIAIVGAALYLFLLLVVSNKRSVFEQLMIPSLPAWLFFGALVEAPLWFWLARIRFVSRRFGRMLMIVMVAIAIFTLIAGLMLPS